MNIVFFMENYYKGGVDTFAINLINHWPNHEDSLSLICNKDHPGFDYIKSKVRRDCAFIDSELASYNGFVNKYRKRPLLNMARKILSPVLRYVFLAYDVVALRRFWREDHDALMVINGGYPGGDLCRAATISWGLFNRGKRCVHNFHNMVMKSRKLTCVQEYIVDSAVRRFTDHFVTVSEAASKSMAARPVIAGKSDVRFVYNGIEVAETFSKGSNIREEIGLSAADKLCLMLGTYEERKGHSFLLKAFRVVVERMPNVHLLICGYGSVDEVATVKALISANALERNVHLMGFKDDISALLESADVLLVASQSFESFGLTCVEAMARKVPVVTTDVGGLPEVVVNGEGGYCVRKDDVDTYAGKIIEIFSDKSLRDQQGAKGFERYKRCFMVENMSSKYSDLIRSVNSYQ